MKFLSNLSKQAKKFNPKILLQNKIVLYLVAATAIVDILVLANEKDYNSVLVFVIIGFLVSFFSKNMIIILLSAILFTEAFKTLLNKKEGMENKKKKKKQEGLEHEDDEEDDEEDEDEEEESNTIKLDMEQTAAAKADEELEKKQRTYDKLKDDFNEFQSIQKDIIKNMKEIDPLLTKAESFIEKFESFKKH
tara:strand:- start:2212 stop:2787 length:576 start_codon:yes stop_codon:yes gene_type:complete